MPPLSEQHLHEISYFLNDHGYSLPDLICSLASSSVYGVSAGTFPRVRVGSGEDPVAAILDRLTEEDATRAAVSQWAIGLVDVVCRQEVTSLTRKESGFHFDAVNTSASQLEEVDLETMVKQSRCGAPTTWRLLRAMLVADDSIAARRERIRERRTTEKAERAARHKAKGAARGSEANAEPAEADAMEIDHIEGGTTTQSPSDPREQYPRTQTGAGGAAVQGRARASGESQDGNDSESEYWRDFPDEGMAAQESRGRQEGGTGAPCIGKEEDEEELYWQDVAEDEEEEDGEDVDELAEEEVVEEDEVVADLKTLVCMSIAMQNTNSRCNTFQSLFGVYLHACNAPESVIEPLARIGLSISPSSINNAVTSLSVESSKAVEALGRSLLTSYAYDNFDMDNKPTLPTIDRPKDSLLHMTSGTLIRLEHRVTKEDLCCSDELWRKTAINPDNWTRSLDVEWTKLMSIHPEPDDPLKPTRREAFNEWKVLSDLIDHGPGYFRQFASKLAPPETIDQIPLVKSKQVPARAMDINQSSVSGNRDAILQLFAQGRVGDPRETPGVTDIGNHEILVHGDLSTCERVQSLQASRAAESTPFRRLQCVVFVIGLFHLKMACADAIWKIFIQPKLGREDDSSLFKLAAEIRPTETGKIASKPGFRRMHELIQHVGIASRLDCWRECIREQGARWENPETGALEVWAEKKPSWDEIKTLAAHIMRDYVADKDFDRERHLRGAESRDMELENTKLREKYFLLYEELTYSMNVGDIGRVETCFMPWVFIFRGCGKHKYATQMTQFLYALHFVYPERLRYAIRMNILCDPTGKAFHFCAVDWWVEHNNLYIKRIYGGKYSNHTKKQIIKQSPLIGVYKNVRMNLEKMLALSTHTHRHSTPKMARTFKKLRTYMETKKVHAYVPGRSSRYTVPDASEAGLAKMMGMGLGNGDEGEGDEGELAVDGEHGDLDV